MALREMRKVLVAPAILITCACVVLDQLVVSGPTYYWWQPIALVLPFLTMALVCFDRSLPIGHYALTVIVATCGIYWIALGVGGFTAVYFENTFQGDAILQALGSSVRHWPHEKTDPVPATIHLIAPLSIFFVVMGFVWLLPTRRVWDKRLPNQVAG
jgi:hypothetical protein